MPKKISIREKDYGFAEFVKRCKEIHDYQIKVGVLADSGKGSAGVEGTDLTLAQLAVILEYGTEPYENGGQHIPPRPALHNAFEKERRNLADAGKRLMGEVVIGKMTTEKALAILGEMLTAAVKKEITEGPGVPPPNAPSTIAKKGSSRPLVDTGRYVNAFSYKVMKGDDE